MVTMILTGRLSGTQRFAPWPAWAARPLAVSEPLDVRGKRVEKVSHAPRADLLGCRIPRMFRRSPKTMTGGTAAEYTVNTLKCP